MKPAADRQKIENATEFETWNDAFHGWPVRVTRYRIGSTCYCQVDNVNPGARIARSSGATHEEATQKAVKRAGERLATTKRAG